MPAADKLGFFNVKDFGAKGDGKTPDSQAIQKAIDAAEEKGGVVWFPQGIYPCHDLKLKPFVKLRGDQIWGYSGTTNTPILQLDSDDAVCIVDVSYAKNAHIAGLQFFGNRNNKHTKRPTCGIMHDPEKWASKCETITIENCKFYYMQGHGVYLNKIFVFIIRGCLFGQNGGCGVKFYGWDGYVIDSIFEGNREHGFGSFNIGASIMFTHNRVEWNRQYGVYIGEKGDYWTITANQFDHNWGAGIGVSGSRNISITGNSFRRNGRDAASCPEGDDTCHIALYDASGVSVVGNNFMAKKSDGGVGQFTPKYGVVMKGSKYCNVAQNNFYRGYMLETFKDLGGNGENLLKDNIGCPLNF
ncbi:MAG: right-handed parallel beta-helix repeat-containing protein [Opitutales bacterium]|nr:right-handed parallel beta-helix repeat-containing protein [Opitutales bacterium]